jgi:hypothetical protein
MPHRAIKRLERLKGHEGQTYRYFERPGSRHRRWVWFDPHEVPEFEGNWAYFECERIPGHWKLLRQVER